MAYFDVFRAAQPACAAARAYVTSCSAAQPWWTYWTRPTTTPSPCYLYIAADTVAPCGALLYAADAAANVPGTVLACSQRSRYYLKISAAASRFNAFFFFVFALIIADNHLRISISGVALSSPRALRCGGYLWWYSSLLPPAPVYGGMTHWRIPRTAQPDFCFLPRFPDRFFFARRRRRFTDNISRLA